jgi:hypothetical protein
LNRSTQRKRRRNREKQKFCRKCAILGDSTAKSLKLHLLRHRLAVLVAQVPVGLHGQRVTGSHSSIKCVTPVCHPRRKKLGVFVAKLVQDLRRRKARIPLFFH